MRLTKHFAAMNKPSQLFLSLYIYLKNYPESLSSSVISASYNLSFIQGVAFLQVFMVVGCQILLHPSVMLHVFFFSGIMELIGIFVGHLYFFLMFKYPQDFGGQRFLSTPSILYVLILCSCHYIAFLLNFVFRQQ